jgi:hypothetical protein
MLSKFSSELLGFPHSFRMDPSLYGLTVPGALVFLANPIREWIPKPPFGFQFALLGGSLYALATLGLWCLLRARFGPITGRMGTWSRRTPSKGY